MRITLNVDGGNNNSRVNVNPTGHTDPDYATVTFETGDVIYVGNNGAYVGCLTYNGSNFSGNIDDSNLNEADYLHFYFMGNKGPANSEPTEAVSITDQTAEYPVISYAHSTDLFKSDVHSYSAKLQNYCAIVKFTTNDIPTATAVTVKGMQNTVSVDFGKNNAAESKLDINPYTPGLSGDGDIILHAVSNTERWAILLAQDEVENATVTATGYENGTCTVPEIVNNTYHSTGVSVDYPEPGLQIGSLVYDNDNHPIAVVAYVGDDYTLAIFLYDWTIQYGPEDPPISNMNWSTAISSIQSFNEFTGLALRLPTEEEWQKMIVACGGNYDGYYNWNCSGLMSTISEAGGWPMLFNQEYWTATEEDQSQAKTIRFENLPEGVMGNFWLSDKGNDLFVRPVIQIGGVQPVTPVTADVTWNINYDFSCNPSCISDGIKAEITVGNKGEAYWNNTRLKLKSGETYIPEAIYPSSLTFTSYRGNISKIVIYGSSVSGPIPSGWSYEDSKLTWEGTPAESVTMMSSSSTTDSFDLFSPRKIEFYLEQGNK